MLVVVVVVVVVVMVVSDTRTCLVVNEPHAAQGHAILPLLRGGHVPEAGHRAVHRRFGGRRVRRWDGEHLRVRWRLHDQG